MIVNSMRAAGVIAALGLLAGCASQASPATPAYTYLPVVCTPTAAPPPADGASAWTEPGTTPTSSTTPAAAMQGCYIAVPTGYGSAGDYSDDYDDAYPYWGYGGLFGGGFIGHGFHDHGFHGGGFHGGGFHGGGGGFHGGGGGGHGR